MLKFNYEYLKRRCEYDCDLVVHYFCLITGVKPPGYMGKCPKRIHKLLLDRAILKGKSFLVNPKKLFESLSRNSPEEVCQYIEYASKRSLLDYNYYRVKTLPVIVLSETEKQKLKFNQLIFITKKDVYFILE